MVFPEQQAIEALTKAINDESYVEKSDPLSLLYSERAKQFLAIAKRILTRPAKLSEHRALNAMEPTAHAKLSKKDALKAFELATTSSNKALAQQRVAEALIMLEKYDEAEEAILSGLQESPNCEDLMKLSQDLNSMYSMDIDTEEKSGVTKNKRRHVDRLDDFDCPLCLKLFYQPITTPCGHTFCRECLQRSTDHSNRCPMCRCLLLMSPSTASVSTVLQSIVKKQFPEEYAQRCKEEATSSGQQSGPNGASLPLFVMDIVFPGQKIYINIFEPRYRLMIRRCMSANRRFGMVGKASSGDLMERATECEILECEPLPDGRFYLEVVGVRVADVKKTWEQDGYRVGELEWIIPESEVPSDADEAKALVQLAEKSQVQLDEMLAGMRKYFDDYHKRAIEEKIRNSGPRPSIENEVSKYSWWLCNLLPLSYSIRMDVIRSKNAKGRLEIAMKRMEAIGNNSNALGKCNIQ